MDQAIVREKQLKHFMRKWKNELVESINPDWKDLAGEIIDNPDIVQIPGQAGDDNNIQARDDDDGQAIGIRISGLRNRLRMGNGHYHDDTEAKVTKNIILQTGQIWGFTSYIALSVLAGIALVALGCYITR